MATGFEWTKLGVDMFKWIMENLKLVIPILMLVGGSLGYGFFGPDKYPVMKEKPVVASVVRTVNVETPQKPKIITIIKPTKVIETTVVETVIAIDEESKEKMRKRLDELEKSVIEFRHHIEEFKKHNEHFH